MNLLREFTSILQRFGLEYFHRYYGTYRAFVVDNNDPEERGRLKLKIPTIHGDQVHDYWAFPKGQYAGNGYGFLMLPKIGDAVYVVFENGDSEHPLWEHGWWAKNEMMDIDSYPDDFVLHTHANHRVELNNKGNNIRIKLSEGSVIEVNDFGISLIRNGGKVSIGALNGSDQPAVLGNDTVSRLESILDHLDDLVTQGTSMTSAFVASNPVAVTTITTQLALLKSKIASTRAQVPSIKSQNVTIDG